MVQINFALKEVNCKVVYYGPGLSGKTTNLEVVHSKAPSANVGELTSIATEGDRTLFFDFLPLNLGHVAGMNTKFQIYTVPGQVYYNSTRKLVLQGADGIVFVADSRKGKMDENIESLSNLEENLREYGMDIHTIPFVIQYNKRDLPDIYSVEELEEKLNRFKAPYFEAVAVTGEGVFPTLKKLSSMVLESLNRQQNSTVVKVPKKQKQAASSRQAVAAGAVAAFPAATATRAPPPSRAAPAPAAAAPARSRAAPPREPGVPTGQVVKEPVVQAPDVKPIERRAPPQRTVAQRRQSVRLPAPKESTPKRRLSPVWLIVIGLLAVAGAAVYFSGVLSFF
jgi:signal recognition particle receptor subunit beta